MAKVLQHTLAATAALALSCTAKPTVIRIYVQNPKCEFRKAGPLAEKHLKTKVKGQASAKAIKNAQAMDFGEEPWYTDPGLEKDPAPMIASAEAPVSESRGWYFDTGFDSAKPLTGADYYLDPGFDAAVPLGPTDYFSDHGLDTTKSLSWKQFAGF